MATATSLPSQNAQLRDSISRLIASSRSRSAGHMAMWHNHACTSDVRHSVPLLQLASERGLFALFRPIHGGGAMKQCD